MRIYVSIILFYMLSSMWIYTTQNVFASKQVNVDIQLWIINAYSGTLSLVGQYYFDWDQYYTADSLVNLWVGATESSRYTVLSDNSSVQSWSWVWDYSTTLWTPLLWPDRLFQFQASFINNSNERVESNIVSVQKDTTPPSTVDNLSIKFAKAWWNSGLYISRDQSSDIWAWVAWYQVLFASDSSMISTKKFTTNSSSILVDTSLIPVWYTTVQIIALDNVWNASYSTPVQYSPSILINESWSNSSVSNTITTSVVSTSKDNNTISTDTNTQDQDSQSDTGTSPIKPNNNTSILIFEDIQNKQDTIFNSQKELWDVDGNIPSKKLLPEQSYNTNTPFIYNRSRIKSSEEVVTKLPWAWVWQVWSWPYSDTYICSDESCLEVYDTWEVCGEVSCIEISHEILHYVATSKDETYYTLFLQYHKDLSRKRILGLILLYYCVCYDIEIHLKRMYLIKNKK